jgi:outer membrane protein W
VAVSFDEEDYKLVLSLIYSLVLLKISDMKKTIVLSVAILSFSFHRATAQTEETTPIKSIHKRNVKIEAFYGFPNLLTAALKNTYELTNQKKEQLSIAGAGPVGLRAEYFITDHLAFGAEISYATTSIQWQERGTIKLNDTTAIPYNYSFKLTAPRIRMLGKFNFHFGTSEHFDWYAGLGIGYNNTRIRLITDAPYIRDYDILSLYFLPLSLRVNFGGNYYFTKNVGIGFEVGLGGPLAAVALTAKF